MNSITMKSHRSFARMGGRLGHAGRAVLVSAVLLVLGGCATAPSPQEKVSGIIRSAEMTLTLFKSSNEKPMQQFRTMMKDAQGVVILPGVLKAGFIIGAEYGNGVLLARSPSGGWSYPAFYTLGAGSIGFQAGGEASDMVMILRTQKAVDAVLKHQGKLGAELGLTFGTVGSGVEAATTTNLGFDIVVFSQSFGLFGGGSLEGAALIRRNDFNTVFYGEGALPEAIIRGGGYSNATADGLRSALGDF